MSGDGGTTRAGEPHPRRRLIFALVVVALLLASIDQTVVATALSAIQEDLDAEIQWSSWTITVYALVQVLAMPVAGRLADMHGRKAMFIIAASLFTVGSLLCAIAQDIALLLLARALQAAGGGMFLPVASGLVSDNFGRDRDRALGLFTTVFPIGAIVGPIVGALFVTYGTWRGIFLFNLPVGIALVIAAALIVPAGGRRGDERLDVPGVFVLGVSLASVMLAITAIGGADGLWRPLFVIPVIVGVVGWTVFVLLARRRPHPVIPLALLAGRGFGAMNVINLVFGAALVGFAAILPLYAIERFGFSALEAGALLTFRAVAMIAASWAAVYLLRRTGMRWPIVVGFTIGAAGMVMMFWVPSAVETMAWLAVGCVVAGIGSGMAVPAANNATLHIAQDKIAAVSGLRGMFRQAGAILGVSLASAVAAQSVDQGVALGLSIALMGVALIVVLPLLVWVPEHRGAW